MLRLLTGGESHGPKLVSILDGMPAGLEVDIDFINSELKKRQGGFGRSGRQKIEDDKIIIVGGVRWGKTTGAPIAYEIQNNDSANWLTVMSVSALPLQNLTESQRKQIADKKINRFRPGHADFAGTVKYRLTDIRDVLERASARETASRVAAGAFTQLLLQQLGITVLSQVVAIGSVNGPCSNEQVEHEAISALQEQINQSRVYCADAALSAKMEAEITQALKNGDSLGGQVQVKVLNVPPGLGSSHQWDRRLDGLLAQALLSIQSAKAIAIGDGVDSSGLPGSKVHDAIGRKESGDASCFYVERVSNHAGGIEGGMTNGEPVVTTVYFKPIPTLKKGLPSLSYPQLAGDFAHYERSDVCAVPAASVVAKAMVSLTMANAFIDKFACDTMTDLKQSVQTYKTYVRELTKGKVEDAS
ncbi:MAG: chorismate synthase [Candidatus Obscuribacter sp.]|nr:chorismate synthase [Candidatus Obscuribacter sp.]